MSTAFKDEPRLLIIGLGLMGASLAAALKTRGYAGKIDGVVRQVSSQQNALQSGWFDRVSLNVDELVADADIIVLATPLGSFSRLLQQIKPQLKSHTLITDVGSVKACVRDAVLQVFGEMPANVVLGHPISGSERSGLSAADADLYQRQTVILTPAAETSATALQVLTQLWEFVGARVTQLSIDEHDHVLAATSHLPHLLAFSLVDTLAGDKDSRAIFEYAAGGFRDFTRIAASDPVMWRDIFHANRVAIKTVAQRFRDDLDQLLLKLDDDQGEQLLTQLIRAKQARDEFSQVLQARQKN
jgi:3-phosphoshikimate 1-carboxyvinyltransferase